jgi:hypothetical protein
VYANLTRQEHICRNDRQEILTHFSLRLQSISSILANQYRSSKECSQTHHSRLADLPFTMDFRNKLVESGRVSAHHILPQSGWVSYWIKGEEDIPNVIELFKMRYDFLNPNRRPMN